MNNNTHTYTGPECSASMNIRNIHIQAASFIRKNVKIFPHIREKKSTVGELISNCLFSYKSYKSNLLPCKVQLRTICYKTILTLPLATFIYFLLYPPLLLSWCRHCCYICCVHLYGLSVGRKRAKSVMFCRIGMRKTFCAILLMGSHRCGRPISEAFGIPPYNSLHTAQSVSIRLDSIILPFNLL